jgi:hypothetical protein
MKPYATTKGDDRLIEMDEHDDVDDDDETDLRPRRRPLRARHTAMHRCVTDSCDCMGHTVRETMCCVLKPVIGLVLVCIGLIALVIYLAVHFAAVDSATIEQMVAEKMGVPWAATAAAVAGGTVYTFDSAVDDTSTAPLAYYLHGALVVDGGMVVNATLHATTTGRFTSALLVRHADGRQTAHGLDQLSFVISTAPAVARLTSADIGPAPSPVLAALADDDPVHLALYKTGSSTPLLVARLVARATTMP